MNRRKRIRVRHPFELEGEGVVYLGGCGNGESIDYRIKCRTKKVFDWQDFRQNLFRRNIRLWFKLLVENFYVG